MISHINTNVNKMSRRRNPVTKNIKDYLVPIVWGILILFLLISIFTGGNEQVDIQKENQLWITVTMDTSNTQSFVIYPGQDKVGVTENISLFKWEQLIVKEGSLSLDIPELWNARLWKLGEMKFNENGSFTHTSGKVWFNTTGNVDINAKFASIKMWENSHVSLDQNEMATTIYSLSGIVEVINIAGQNVLLLPGEKISISRLDANNWDLDMKSLKMDIDDLFKNDDWYILNNWDKYLNKPLDEDEDNVTATWSTLISNSSRVLIFDNIEDEANIDSASLDIKGKFWDDTIVKITMNNSEAKINTEKKTFIIEWVDTSNNQNDLVFRAYDDAWDVLEKKLITLYYNGVNNSNNSSSFGNVKTYDDVDASQFIFTEPSKFTTFSTKASEVTIKWQVLNKDVAIVKVNGYQLKSYSPVYGTWRYYAFERFNTLGNGSNVYTVRYYDKNNKLIYTNNYTIVKNADLIKKNEWLVSDEVNVEG